ncbi:hypothetical protein ABPG72_020771 [Tetrahymena utriculariae]
MSKKTKVNNLKKKIPKQKNKNNEPAEDHIKLISEWNEDEKGQIFNNNNNNNSNYDVTKQQQNQNTKQVSIHQNIINKTDSQQKNLHNIDLNKKQDQEFVSQQNITNGVYQNIPNLPHNAKNVAKNILNPKIAQKLGKLNTNDENNLFSEQNIKSTRGIQDEKTNQRKKSLKGIADQKKTTTRNEDGEQDDFEQNFENFFGKLEKKTGAQGVQKNKQPLKLGQFKFKQKPVKQSSIEILQEEYYTNLFKLIYQDYNPPSITKNNQTNNQNNSADLFDKIQQSEKNFLQQELEQLAIQMGFSPKEAEQDYELFQKMVLTQIDDDIEKETDPFNNVVYFNNQLLKIENKHPFFNRYMTIIEDFQKQSSLNKYRNEEEQEGYFAKKKVTTQLQLKQSQQQQQQLTSQNSVQLSHLSSKSSFTRDNLSSVSYVTKGLRRKRTQQSSQASVNSLRSTKSNVIVKKQNKKHLYNHPEMFTIVDNNCQMTQTKLNELLGQLEEIKEDLSENLKINNFEYATPKQIICLLQKAQTYYEDYYGFNLEQLQYLIQNQISYWKLDPQDVAQEIVNLQIYDFEDLYWLARVKLSIELPPDWIKIYDNQLIYKNIINNKAMTVHPCHSYIRVLIKNEYDKLKEGQQFNRNNNLILIYKDQQGGTQIVYQLCKSHFMIFKNHLNEEYSIDINLIVADILNNSKEKVNDLLQHKINLNDKKENNQKSVKEMIMETENQINQLAKVKNQNEKDGDLLNDTELIGDQQENGREAKQDLDFGYYDSQMNQQANSESQKQKILKNNKKRKQIYQENLLDDHLLIICQEVDIQLPQEVHLLALVSEYLLYIEKDPQKTNWRFRVNQETGIHYWINKEKNETVKSFPYKQELEEILDYYQKTLDQESQRFKLKKGVLKHILKYIVKSEEENEITIFSQLQEEAQNFVLHFISHYKKFENIYEYDPILNHPQLTYRHFLLEQEGIEFYSLNNINKYLIGDKIILQDDLKQQLLFWWPYQLQLKKYLDKDVAQQVKNTNQLLQDEQFLSNAFDKDEFEEALQLSIHLEASSEEEEEEEESEGEYESYEDEEGVEGEEDAENQSRSSQAVLSDGSDKNQSSSSNSSSSSSLDSDDKKLENSKELEEQTNKSEKGSAPQSPTLSNSVSRKDSLLKNGLFQMLQEKQRSRSLLGSRKNSVDQKQINSKFNQSSNGGKPGILKVLQMLKENQSTSTNVSQESKEQNDQSQNIEQNSAEPQKPLSVLSRFKRAAINAAQQNLFVKSQNTELSSIQENTNNIQEEQKEKNSENKQTNQIQQQDNEDLLNAQQQKIQQGQEVDNKQKKKQYRDSNKQEEKNRNKVEDDQIIGIAQLAGEIFDKVQKKVKKRRKKVVEKKPEKLALNQIFKKYNGNIRKNRIKEKVEQERLKVLLELKLLRQEQNKNVEKKKMQKKKKKKNLQNSSDEEEEDDLNESGFLSQASTQRDYFRSSQTWFEDQNSIALNNQQKEGKKVKKPTYEQKIKQQVAQKSQVDLKKKKEAIKKFNYQDFFMREINENYLYKQDFKKMRADIREQRRCKIKELFDMMQKEYMELKQEQSQIKVIEQFQFVNEQNQKSDSFLSQFEKYYLQKREMFKGISDKLDSLLLITSNPNDRISLPKKAIPENQDNDRQNIIHNFHKDSVVKVFKINNNLPQFKGDRFCSTSPIKRSNQSNQKQQNMLGQEIQLEQVNQCLKPKLQPLQSRPSTSSQSTRPCTARSTSAKSSKRKVIDASLKIPNQNKIQEIKVKNQNFIKVQNLIEANIDNENVKKQSQEEFKLQEQVFKGCEKIENQRRQSPSQQQIRPTSPNNSNQSQISCIYQPRKIDFSISRDLMSRIRVNRLLENLCDQKSDYIKVEQKDGNQFRNYFKLISLDQLFDLKYSLLEEKLNQLIFEYIMKVCKGIQPQQKLAFEESSELKIRFYFMFQELFQKIKLFLYSLSSIQCYKDYFYAFLNRKTQLISKIINVKFGIEIQNKINDKIQSIFPKLLEEQELYLDQFQNGFDYVDSPFTHNPFKITFNIIEQDFFIDQIKSYVQNKYESEIRKVENFKRHLWRQEKLQQIIQRRKLNKQLDDELKILERENESESDDEQEDEIKKLEKLTPEQLHLQFMLEKYNESEIPYQKQKDKSKNLQDNPQLVVKFLPRIIENQEKVYYLKQNHRMFRILLTEIGQIHKVNKNNILKYEAFNSNHLTPNHVFRMAKKLKFDQNFSLYWISYLYCMFILRYSQDLICQQFKNNETLGKTDSSDNLNDQKTRQEISKENDFLEKFIESENDYDLYFEVLAEFQAIKSDLLQEFLAPKQKLEYLEIINWFSFIDETIPFQVVEDKIDLAQLYKQPLKLKPKEEIFYMNEIKHNPKVFYFNAFTKTIRTGMPQNIIDLKSKYLNSEKVLLADIIYQISELIMAKH